jgi:hypothetical protein
MFVKNHNFFEFFQKYMGKMIGAEARAEILDKLVSESNKNLPAPHPQHWLIRFIIFFFQVCSKRSISAMGFLVISVSIWAITKLKMDVPNSTVAPVVITGVIAAVTVCLKSRHSSPTHKARMIHSNRP